MNQKKKIGKKYFAYGSCQFFLCMEAHKRHALQNPISMCSVSENVLDGSVRLLLVQWRLKSVTY